MGNRNLLIFSKRVDFERSPIISYLFASSIQSPLNLVESAACRAESIHLTWNEHSLSFGSQPTLGHKCQYLTRNIPKSIPASLSTSNSDIYHCQRPNLQQTKENDVRVYCSHLPHSNSSHLPQKEKFVGQWWTLNCLTETVSVLPAPIS